MSEGIKLKRQLVLLVVGPDMCGKTHIVTEISRLLGVPSFKASGEHRTFLGTQKSFIDELRHADPRMIDFLRQTRHNAIFDRAYPCERVYSTFFQRETDEIMLKYVDSGYASLNAKILLCDRDSFFGIQDDLDPRINQQQLERLSSLYRDFAAWTSCSTYRLAVDDECLDREINEVIDWLKREDVVDV